MRMRREREAKKEEREEEFGLVEAAALALS